MQTECECFCLVVVGGLRSIIADLAGMWAATSPLG